MEFHWPAPGVWCVLAALTHFSPAPALAQRAPRGALESLESLRSDARSPYPDRRRRTVSKLAKLGGEPALDMIVAALADDEPEVADEAQRVVVQLEADGARSQLLGRAGLGSKDSLVRRRAAEALGRLGGPVSGVELARALDRREPELTRTILWSMERLAAREALTGSAEVLHARLRPFLGRRADDRVRAAALQALVEVDPERATSTLAALEGVPGTETACSALVALVALRPEGYLATLEERLGSADPMVRTKAATLACRVDARRTTLLALVGLLDKEPRPAVRGHAVTTLRRLTGLRHGDRPEAWRHAIERLPEGWSARATTRGDGQTERPAGGSVATLRRLDPRSDRLAVLVDFSGSLWNRRDDGSCRKDLLDPEVAGLMERLDRDGVFFLVPFATEPHPFTSEPVRATARNVKNAQRYFARATMRGKGNLYDALTLALAQREIDRILVVTDGAPTGGHRWNVDLMIDLIRERTRFWPVTFDFVLIDAPSRLVQRWQGLAEGSGGRVVTIET